MASGSKFSGVYFDQFMSNSNLRGAVFKGALTLYGLIKTAEQRTLYSNTVIGR